MKTESIMGAIALSVTLCTTPLQAEFGNAPWHSNSSQGFELSKLTSSSLLFAQADQTQTAEEEPATDRPKPSAESPAVPPRPGPASGQAGPDASRANDTPTTSATATPQTAATAEQNAPSGSTRRRRRSSTNAQTASAAKTYGKLFSTQSFALLNSALNHKVTGQMPVPGRVQVAENNSAMPRDRFFFVYNHFHNALQFDLLNTLSNTTEQRSIDVNRYTIGVEKTLADGLWSVEMRMPLLGISDVSSNSGFQADGLGVGNLAIFNKFLIHQDDTSAVSLGLSLTAPTGDDSILTLGQESFQFRNRTAHLSPFMGFLYAPNNRWFHQGFAQFDIPLVGNRLDFHDLSTGMVTELGRINTQSVMFLDYSLGRWWYQNPGGRNVTAVSSAVELHYVRAMRNPDTLAGDTTSSNYNFENLRERFDVLTLTTGIDIEVRNRVNFRVAGMFPISNDRFFDAEIQATINWHF